MRACTKINASFAGHVHEDKKFRVSKLVISKLPNEELDLGLSIVVHKPQHPHKIRSYLPSNADILEVASCKMEAHHLAGSFRQGDILLQPSGMPEHRWMPIGMSTLRGKLKQSVTNKTLTLYVARKNKSPTATKRVVDPHGSLASQAAKDLNQRVAVGPSQEISSAAAAASNARSPKEATHEHNEHASKKRAISAKDGSSSTEAVRRSSGIRLYSIRPCNPLDAESTLFAAKVAARTTEHDGKGYSADDSDNSPKNSDGTSSTATTDIASSPVDQNDAQASDSDDRPVDEPTGEQASELDNRHAQVGVPTSLAGSDDASTANALDAATMTGTDSAVADTDSPSNPEEESYQSITTHYLSQNARVRQEYLELMRQIDAVKDEQHEIELAIDGLYPSVPTESDDSRPDEKDTDESQHLPASIEIPCLDVNSHDSWTAIGTAIDELRLQTRDLMDQTTRLAADLHRREALLAERTAEYQSLQAELAAFQLRYQKAKRQRHE